MDVLGDAAAAAADQDERTTAQGLFVYGDSYLASASALQRSRLRIGHAESPVRFLLYHAAELHLKAYLRATGLTVADLEDKRHKFTKLIAACRKHGLRLERHAEEVLIYGQRSRDVIETRYLRTGARQRIPTAALGLGAAMVRRAVRTSPKRLGHIAMRDERLSFIDRDCELAWGLDDPPADSKV